MSTGGCDGVAKVGGATRRAQVRVAFAPGSDARAAGCAALAVTRAADGTVRAPNTTLAVPVRLIVWLVGLVGFVGLFGVFVVCLFVGLV
jgi:hypothetical protein